MKKETHDIPEWAIYYLEYGECDGLTEDEVDMLTAFITFNFPLGYTIPTKHGLCGDGSPHFFQSGWINQPFPCSIRRLASNTCSFVHRRTEITRVTCQHKQMRTHLTESPLFIC